MRKGIALLFTLGIISLISLLLIQNYSAIDRYISQKNKSQNQAFLHIKAQNLQEQIVKLINDNSELIESILPIGMIPIQTDSTNVTIKYIQWYENNININNVVDDNLLGNFNFYNFLNLDERKFTSSKQIRGIIRDYLLLYEDEQIEHLKNDFTFFNNEGGFIESEFEFNFEDVLVDFYFIYDMNRSEVKDFEIWY